MFNGSVMTVGDWLVFGILMAIPFVNILVWIILLLSSSTNQSLRNLLKAQIVLVLLGVGLFMFFGTAIFAFMENVPV